MKKCPIDKVPLTRVQYEFVPIWICLDCAGTFLEKGQVSDITEKQESTNDELIASIEEKKQLDTLEIIRCPRCRMQMKKQSALKEVGHFHRGQVIDFKMDVCLNCESVWLDGGEFEKLELDFQQSMSGEEKGKQYVSYAKLNDEDRREYIKTMANANADSAAAFSAAMVQLAQELADNASKKRSIS